MWVRTHELILRRLQARGWGHVLFYCGVPGDERPALIDRFHDDPNCRLFLSTDAGGVGLNHAHAADDIRRRGPRKCEGNHTHGSGQCAFNLFGRRGANFCKLPEGYLTRSSCSRCLRMSLWS